MSLYDQVMKEITQLNSIDQLSDLLEPYYDRAKDDLVYYNDLLKVAEYFGLSGFREVQIDILSTLYNIQPSNKTAYLIAEANLNYAQYEPAYEWILKIKEDVIRYKSSILKAKIMIELGYVNEAKDLLTLLIKEFVTNHEAYILLADLFEANNQYDRAAIYYQTAYTYFDQQIDQRAVRMKLLKIEIMKEIIDIDKIEQLVETEGLPLETADEFYTMAIAYQRAMQYEQSIDYAIRAVQTDKNLVDARFLLMELYEATGQKSNLKKELSFLSATLPAYHAAIMDVAATAHTVGALNEILIEKLVDYFQFTESVEEQYDIIRMVVSYQLSIDQPQAALEILQEMSYDFPDEAYLSYLFATVYRMLGKVDFVEAFYQIALEQLTPELELVYDVVTFYQEQQQLQEAYDIAEHYKSSLYDTTELQDLRKQLSLQLNQQ